MLIKTKYFGEREIDNDKVIIFPQGLLGLEEYKRYTVFEMPNTKRISCLQCVDEHRIAFLIINPWDFFPDYDIQISDDELAVIGIAEAEQMAIFNLLTVGEPITANLLAPVVINLATKTSMQIVLNENKYKTKHPLPESGQEV